MLRVQGGGPSPLGSFSFSQKKKSEEKEGATGWSHGAGARNDGAGLIV